MQAADVLLTGGSIHTQDPKRPAAHAIAVSDGRILAFDDEARSSKGPRTRVVELPTTAAVVPGFVDAHVHFGSFALSRLYVDLDQAATLEDGLALLREAAHKETGWVRGRGWDRNRWGRLPTAADLDTVLEDTPAVLQSHDGHALWLNSAALRAVGVDASTEPPKGGVIERDEQGQPTGVLFENAQDVIRERVPQPSVDELKDAIARALPIATAAGITGIHNLEDRRSREAFAALESSGALTLRVYHGVTRGELRHAKERGLRTGIGSDWLRTGPVKLFSDGALGSRTAHMLEPYEGRADGYRGVATMQAEELREAIRTAAGAQLDIAVHAIGDAAVRSVLDAFESTLESDPAVYGRMLRIEHAQIVDPADAPRFAQLGAIASMQPIHAAADWRTANAHWGARSRHAYGWASLLRARATLAFGTDAPVEHIEPLLNLHAALTRTDLHDEPAGGWNAEQRVSLDEALYAYTAGSARAERAAHRRGALKTEFDADLVVLDPDPFSVPVDHVRHTRVLLTMVGGRIVHEGG